MQSVYYGLKLDHVCRKIRSRHKFEYDINAILSDLVYTRILEPSSKRSSFQAASQYLEPPSYALHDSYRAMSTLAEECELYSPRYIKTAFSLEKEATVSFTMTVRTITSRSSRRTGMKNTAKARNTAQIRSFRWGFLQMGMASRWLSLFPGNSNEQASLKPLEKKILQEFGHDKFIYCSDAGLGSEANREFNHMGQRAFIVTQPIKKLPAEERKRALERTGLKRVSDESIAGITSLDQKDKGSLFYKDAPYTTKKLHQRLAITYSPKYAAYQKTIRGKQIERAEKMVSDRKMKKQRKNPNDPARFVGKMAVTEDGEKAGIHYYLDEEKIAEEEKYNGLYAVCTGLLDDPVKDILRVSEARWQTEDCFRTMKTDFSARPVYVQRKDRITAHFLTCFLALLIYRMLEKNLGRKYTCEKLLGTLKGMNFADVEGQGYMPLYQRETITDDLHAASGFRTDFQLITKRQMKTIQKRSKGRE